MTTADTTDDAPAASALTMLAVLLSAPTADGATLPRAAKVRILQEARRGALNMARALEMWCEAIRADTSEEG